MKRLASVELQSQNLSREEMNLAEVVEEVATQAVRGVQMDIRLIKLTKHCQQILSIKARHDQQLSNICEKIFE